jgi:hypothetical protein
MAEKYTPNTETDVTVYQIPRRRRALIATAALLAATELVSGCAADEKQCEVVGTHVIELGDTAWDTIDNKIPEADQDKAHDVRERMDWVQQVNPDVNIGNLRIGDTVNIPGNCK